MQRVALTRHVSPRWHRYFFNKAARGAVGDFYRRYLQPRHQFPLPDQGHRLACFATSNCKVQTGEGDSRFTLEDLATKFEREEDKAPNPAVYALLRQLHPSRRAAQSGECGGWRSKGATVIKNYRAF